MMEIGPHFETRAEIDLSRDMIDRTAVAA